MSENIDEDDEYDEDDEEDENYEDFLFSYIMICCHCNCFTLQFNQKTLQECKTDLICSKSQVSKVTLCVQILKWQSVSQ